MKKIIVLYSLVWISYQSFAQSENFKLLKEKYQTEIGLPVVVSELHNTILIDQKVLNELLFENQEERAKFYSVGGKLVRVTTYGKIPQEPFEYETWEKENGEVKWFTKSFPTKAYSLGQISLNGNYNIWITKVVGFQKTYIDLHVFDKSGKLKSLVNLFESEYESVGDPSIIANVYITSTIQKDGTILWEENRFSVKTIREYRLQSDGYFKVIKQVSEGEFEP